MVHGMGELNVETAVCIKQAEVIALRVSASEMPLDQYIVGHEKAKASGMEGVKKIMLKDVAQSKCYNLNWVVQSCMNVL